MSGKIWVSLMMVDSTLIKSLRADIVLNNEPNAIDASERHAKGEWLPVDRFPKEIYGAYYDRREMRLPDLFYGNGFWCVSNACAEVLQKFDLGKGGVYPVKLLQYDRVTPIEGEYFCLNFGAHKAAFLPNLSIGLSKPWDNSDFLWLKATVEDFNVAVSAAALEGPDLWLDPTLGKAVFLSNRLVEALKVAKMARKFKLRQCRVVETQ